MGSARLYFSISKGAVWGTTRPRCFSNLRAKSGGGGGSTLGRVDKNVVNNPDKTGQVTQYGKHHVHGGPLPVHVYEIKKPAIHDTLGRSAQLIPRGGGSMLGRSDFFFHGAGKHGSDGCIVLPDAAQFKALMDALAASNGGTLQVLR